MQDIMSHAAEHGALQQLQQQQSRLLDKIDELRTIGVGGLVELPQLIVCGNQSSGKSSVLEAISRVRFPAKSNVCTRFATEVILRRSQRPRIKISIEPGASRSSDQEKRKHLQRFTHEEFSDGNDLPDLIEKAKDHMGISETVNSGFSDDVLRVEISGPDKPELTLVDLPGLYYSTSQQQGKEGITIVRNLTEKYMKNSRSIILAVISAKTDYHLQEVLNIAETFDGKRHRTIGIITQPDILESNSEEEETYLKFIRNEKIQLRLGWHALRNRSFESRNASDDARDAQEKEFFDQGQWASIPRESVGVDSLRRRLSSILLNHIQQNLPDLIADIQKKILDRDQKLSKLGGPRSTLQQQRGFLLNISSAFERISGQALNGMYTDQFFTEAGKDKNGRLLRAIIRQLNEYFSEAMTIRGSRREILDAMSPAPTIPSSGFDNPYIADLVPETITRSALEAESTELARQNRGVELPGSANQLLVGNLFRDQSKPWEGLARSHLLKAWDAVRYFVFLLLQHLTDEHTTSLLVGTIVEPKLDEMKQALLGKLEELTAYTKRGHPLPVGNSFLTQIQKARSERLLKSLKAKLTSGDPTLTAFSMSGIEQAVAELEKSRDEFAAGEIVDQMQAYYDVAIVTFVDNVATLGIENCLLEPLQRLFTSQVVNDMEDSQLQQIAAEPLYVSEERNRLTRDLEKLQAGLRTFNMFRPVLSPLSDPFTLSSKDVAPPPQPTETPKQTAVPLASYGNNVSNVAQAPVVQAPVAKSSPNPKVTISAAASQEAGRAPNNNHPSIILPPKGSAVPSDSPGKGVNDVVSDRQESPGFGGTPTGSKGVSNKTNNPLFGAPMDAATPSFGSAFSSSLKTTSEQPLGNTTRSGDSYISIFASASPKPSGDFGPASSKPSVGSGSVFAKPSFGVDSSGGSFGSVGNGGSGFGRASSPFGSTASATSGPFSDSAGLRAKSHGGLFGSTSTSTSTKSTGGFAGFGASAQSHDGSAFGAGWSPGPAFGSPKMPPDTKDKFR
ncbi:P-loop containing nucleoside triphosphate hydrolase protein [Aspergillus undulatus]|uniref:P-loop containing nucleoside triphosphate hydrolase protein n=1 Tax=Aspergillus undulatus TaxID=1810928 RepID=UPI003CCE35AA